MQATKAQIITGAANFLRAEVIPHIPDVTFRGILEAGAAIVEMSPQIADKYFTMPIVTMALQEKDGMYDLDFAEAAVCKAMETHGNWTVTIPGIKFISPQEKTLTFTPNDVKTLKRYIAG